MATVFVDTAAWLALFNSRDAYHAEAVRTMRSLEQGGTEMVTTEFVLLEVADALPRLAHRARAIGFLNDLRLLPNLLIVAATNGLLDEGWSLYKSRPDKEWGLTDCTSFVVMRRHGLTEAFTSDHHFEQANFIKLL